jgi:phosphatidylglycerophosphatase A
MKPISAVPSNIPFGIKLIITFFYAGYFPVAPGTFASAAALILYFPLLLLNQWPVYLITIIVVTLAGIWASGRAEKISGISDPSFVVIDEVAGQLITLFLLPFSWKMIIAGFLIFRIFDVLKPFPAGRAEKLHGGWGIMMDDVLCGVYGNILLRLILYLWPNVLV